MTTPEHDASLEAQIDQWRSYLRRRQTIHSVDVEELEDHLREQVPDLFVVLDLVETRVDVVRHLVLLARKYQ